jgi:dipeptidyl aminopeptidase/acylaminoacyl peptidase
MRTRSLVLSVVLALVLAAPAAATLPGRNGKIAVAANSDSQSDTIWVGGVRRGLRALPSPCPPGPWDPPWDSCYAAAPSWSPDGTRLALTVLRQSEAQLWIVDADGSDLHRVPGARAIAPAWSPDGARLVFSVEAPDVQECPFRDLYTVNADGTGLTLLTHHGDNPDWSVRGQIVFERQREHWTSGDASECVPLTSIAVMRPGGEPRRVAGIGGGPTWAPGGRTIAYVSARGLRRKAIGAKGPGRLLRKYGPAEPAWSPDGRFILFLRGVRLGMVEARTGHSVPVAFNAPGIDFSPSWQPLPR